MRVNRRKFIITASVGAAGIALTGLNPAYVLDLPKTKIIATIPRGLTIAQIVAATYDPVLTDMRDGKPWVSPVLNRLTEQGYIKILPLGETVELAGAARRRVFEIEQLNVPVTWTRGQEYRHRREDKRIAFASALTKNGILSCEDRLEDMTKTHALVVSSTFRVIRSEVYSVKNMPASYFLIYAAYAAIPKDVFNAYVMTVG